MVVTVIATGFPAVGSEAAPAAAEAEKQQPETKKAADLDDKAFDDIMDIFKSRN